MVATTDPTHFPLPLTQTVGITYRSGLTDYPLVVTLYTPNRFDPLAEWECESIKLDLPGIGDASMPDLWNIFEAIKLAPTDPTRPSWGFSRTAAQEIVERATEMARGKR